MKKKVMCLAAVTAVLVIGVASYVLAQDKLDITTIVKITGINWFNRMEEGVKQYAADSGNNAVQTGPAQADAAQQLKVVQDTLAANPDAIAVVPFDPATLEPVFKEALDRGIKVITHEADNQVNTLYDIEAFDNMAFGGQLNERLAECMGGEGKWTVFVGSLGSKTHNQWADGGIENAAAHHPGLELVDAKQETFDDADQAYNKAKELKASKAVRQPMSQALDGPLKKLVCKTLCAFTERAFPRLQVSLSRRVQWTASASGTPKMLVSS
jgi:simple sugar transport system substrate-binding protein